jgi:hypothetical protein
MTQVWVMVFVVSTLGQMALTSMHIQNCLLRSVFESAISARAYLNAMASYVWRWIVFPFIQHVYLHAPYPLGWGGQDSLQVCAGLTRLDQADLYRLSDACEKRIQREVYGYVVVIELGLFLYLAYKSMSRWLRMSFAQPSPRSPLPREDKPACTVNLSLAASGTPTTVATPWPPLEIVELVDAASTATTLTSSLSSSPPRMVAKALLDEAVDAVSPITSTS